MSLTDSQIVKVHMYLGLGDEGDYELEADLLDLDSATETEIVSILTRLEAVESALDNNALYHAGVRKVDEIEFFEGRSETDLRRRGRMLCNRLAIILETEIVRDAFGSGSTAFLVGHG